MHFDFLCIFLVFRLIDTVSSMLHPPANNRSLISSALVQIFLNLLHFHLSRLIFNNFPNFPRFLFDVDDMKKRYPAIHTTAHTFCIEVGTGTRAEAAKIFPKKKKSDGSASINL